MVRKAIHAAAHAYPQNASKGKQRERERERERGRGMGAQSWNSRIIRKLFV